MNFYKHLKQLKATTFNRNIDFCETFVEEKHKHAYTEMQLEKALKLTMSHEVTDGCQTVPSLQMHSLMIWILCLLQSGGHDILVLPSMLLSKT